MKKDPLISLIIAFYNEEQFLGRCLESVVNQNYNHFEVLLINDGSTDTSQQIAERYADSFSKVNLITTENSGHAQARNIGLQNCTGDYVTFLDADDILETDMMETFRNQIIKFKTDLIICDISVYSEDGNKEYGSNWNKEIAEIGNTKTLINALYSGGVSENVWAKVFNTTLAKQISFEKGLWFDDRPFLLEYLYLSKTVTFVDKKLLKIYRRNSSITRRKLEPKRIIDAYKVFELELNIARKYNSLKVYKNRVGKFALSVFVDTYIMQIIDKDRIAQITNVRKTFLEYLTKLKDEIKLQRIELNFKDRLVLRLLFLPKLLGWNSTNLFFLFLKRKRIKKVEKLKNQ